MEIEKPDYKDQKAQIIDEDTTPETDYSINQKRIDNECLMPELPGLIKLPKTVEITEI